MLLLVALPLLIRSLTALAQHEHVVPAIVHMTYDYQSPNFFLFLSLLTVVKFLKPQKLMLWVNDEGRYRKAHWESWQRNAKAGSWEYEMLSMLQNVTITHQFVTFPAHPEGKPELIATNKAHRSDFLRMKVLESMGGMYLDTDAFVLGNLDELRQHNFTLAFDNIVDLDPNKPKRLNNGVLLSSPHAAFLRLWMKEYQNFNPASFDYDSSVVPYRLATMYPDLVHIEMSRLSPISYGFQTSKLAEAMTCAIFIPPSNTIHNWQPFVSLQLSSGRGALWYPSYDYEKKAFSYQSSMPDEYMFEALRRKLVLHMTMSQVRGICMMRKQLSSPADLQYMPSFLGHVFRLAYYGYDDYNYGQTAKLDIEGKNALWNKCRSHFGMHYIPDRDDKSRQQYIKIE